MSERDVAKNARRWAAKPWVERTCPKCGTESSTKEPEVQRLCGNPECDYLFALTPGVLRNGFEN